MIDQERGLTVPMKYSSIRLAAILVAALSLCACAPQPRRVLFNEAAFTGYSGSGSGTITGTAFIIMKDRNYQKTASSNAVVKLLPANAYTEEIVTRHYFNREKLEAPDPHLSKYVRRVHADNNGHFTFNGV